MKQKTDTDDYMRISPSPHAGKIWRVYSVLLIVPLTMFLLMVGVYRPIVAVMMGIVVLLLYLLLLLYVIPAYVRSCLYELTAEGVRISGGFFYLRTSQIQYHAIQYCVLSQSIVQRVFGVCSVSLMMAGSSSVMWMIPLTDGKKIRSLLEKRIFGEEGTDEPDEKI